MTFRLVLAVASVVTAVATPAMADGRSDWQDYAWQTIAYANCPGGIPEADGLCPAYHQKWDWKRNQWVDIAFRFDPANGKFAVVQRLTNNDRTDDDHVCVTALFVDAQGHDLYAYHQNWHSQPHDTMRRTFRATLPRAIFATAAKVIIGSKQCRMGEHQDDDLFSAVKTAIGQ